MAEKSRPEADGHAQRASGEHLLVDLLQTLIDHPMFENAVAAASGARDRALEAQKAAMEALDLPSASEIERLERRLRLVSERLEGLEEQIDLMASDLAAIRREVARPTAAKRSPKPSTRAKPKPRA